jgi:hypothetical protein
MDMVVLGKKHTKGEPFLFKKVMYNKYYSTQWAKILMASFGYPKH